MGWYTFHRRDLGEGERAPNRKRAFVIAALIFLFVFVSLTVVGFAWAKKDVVVLDGEDKQTISTFKRTVGDVLAASGVELGTHDRVDPALDTKLEDGMEIVISRAIPVTVQIDGDKRREMTTARTVGELIDELDLTVGSCDLVRPERSTVLEPDLAVAVIRVTEETVEEEAEIPFGVTRRTAYNLEKGKTKVQSAGSPGLEKKTWKVTYHDGVEVSRELVSSETVCEPENQVVLVGAMDTVSRGGQDLRFSRALTARATAYTYTGRNTATGKPPGPGTVAVDPTVIPMGSRLYIDGYGHGTAMDVGRSIKGNRIDVFFPTRAQALNWGSRTVNVYVLE